MQDSLSSDAPASGVLLDSSYDTFDKIYARGEHLEHLHAYTPAGDKPDQSLFVGTVGSPGYTLPMHTDGGLFIAMTNGYYADQDGQPVPVQNGLYVTLPTGAVVRAVTEEDALIFMMGQGAADWLAPKLGKPLRAVPHAMIADTSSSESKPMTRAWFGKMYLPPADAVSAAWNGRSYGNYRELLRTATASAVASGDKFVSTLPAACGSGPIVAAKGHSAQVTSDSVDAYTALFKPVVSNTLCPDGNGVMCWQNVSLPDIG